MIFAMGIVSSCYMAFSTYVPGQFPFCLLMACVFVVISIWFVIKTKKRQALHDLDACTRVVKKVQANLETAQNVEPFGLTENLK